jgi:outer membrane protein
MSNRISVKICGFLLGTMACIFCLEGAQAGKWGLGVVAESHQAPLKGADRIDTGVLPFFYYEGDSLTVDFQEISYKLLDLDKFELAALGRIRFQGYDPEDSPELEGMDERDPTFDAGLRLAYGGRWGNVSLSAVTDVTDNHNGQEVTATYGISFQNGRWTIEPSVGLSWQSENLVDYYYGVRSSEARSGRPAYTGHSATNVLAGLNASFKITRHFFTFAGTEYRYLGNSIRTSPVIKKEYEAGGYVGFLYRF